MSDLIRSLELLKEAASDLQAIDDQNLGDLFVDDVWGRVFDGSDQRRDRHHGVRSRETGLLCARPDQKCACWRSGMMDEDTLKIASCAMRDLHVAVSRLESCELNGGELYELDKLEGDLIEARNSVEGVIASVLRSFGVHASVELNWIMTCGVE